LAHMVDHPLIHLHRYLVAQAPPPRPGADRLWWTTLSRQKSPKFKLRVHVQQKTCCVLPE
jgi:hypothetical protein